MTPTSLQWKLKGSTASFFITNTCRLASSLWCRSSLFQGEHTWSPELCCKMLERCSLCAQNLQCTQ